MATPPTPLEWLQHLETIFIKHRQNGLFYPGRVNEALECLSLYMNGLVMINPPPVAPITDLRNIPVSPKEPDKKPDKDNIVGLEFTTYQTYCSLLQRLNSGEDLSASALLPIRLVSKRNTPYPDQYEASLWVLNDLCAASFRKTDVYHSLELYLEGPDEFFSISAKNIICFGCGPAIKDYEEPFDEKCVKNYAIIQQLFAHMSR
ncbi:hypothetical protein BDV96DRAFT_642844 [Lophiotrema nucula]|uniref:Uncharacterized protein n=1 Tax=Lophiotrema nucula TaxID=690887 RepID=A0A6A5ZK82_9PLEO|nr:hypothetical protein BDV96DRAFT_642844 [Lophiotrema nucula]